MGRGFRWKALLGLGAVSALMVFGVVGAQAALGFHGIAFNKGCESPTKIGDPYSCAYQILNVVDTVHDTLKVTGLSDQVHSAGGDVNSGNLLPALQLVFSGPTVTCVGGSGSGTAASPYIGATECTLPFGTTITTNAFSFYTVAAGDFGLAGHTLTDTAKLNWFDTCDIGATPPSNCTTDPQTATAGSSSLIEQLQSSTATQIHDAAHNVVTTVEAGSTVHDFVTVTGQPGQPFPSGNVKIDWFLNNACSGNPAATTTTGPLVNGQFDAVGFAQGPLAAGFFGFQAHYLGDATYIGSDGACEPLQVVDANIQLTPPTATNHVGTNHVLTCHINVDDGNGFLPAPAGTVCTVSIISGPGSPVSQNCSTVGATGDCQVAINSNATGQSTIRASTNVDVAGVTLHRETGDAHAGDSADAQKLWVNAAIVIAPNATNEIGQPHTFTATLLFDTGSGLQPAGANQPVTITLTNGNGAVANPAGPFNLMTNAAGQVSVTFTSATPGTVTGHASWTGSVSGSAPFTVETDGVAPNSGNAVKTFVDANIQLTPATATNVVGTNHTLHCHINVNAGDGNGYVNAPAGTICTVTILSGPGTPATQNCTVGATGTCDVVITSATTGTTTLRASTDVAVGGVSLHRETGDAHAGDGPDAQKTWVNAKISIAPNATNEVGAPHTFTVTLEKDTGSGFGPAAGEHVDVTLTDALGANHTAPTGTCTNAGANTNAAGQCTITFTSPTAGTVTGTASSTLSVSGQSITVSTNGVAPNSGPAVKTFVDANIQLTPGTATNPVNTNHTLHCHININAGDGNGFVNAPAGTNCTVTIISGPGTPATQNCTTVGNTGTCDVIITSATPGTSTIQATTTLAVLGVTMTRTTGDAHVGDGPNAVKLWADDTVSTTVRDAANNDITNQTVAGGTVVHDTATVTKAAGTPAGVPNPTGTVNFTLFDNGTCNGNVLATDPNKPLVAGTASSVDFTTPASGSFSYLAHYNGDANYPAHDGPCEPFTVASQTGKNLKFGGSMEGALKWSPGAFVNGGYHFWLSTKNPVPVTVQVTGTIDVPVHCGGPHGPLVGTISVPVSIAPFTIPANSTAKYLTADQNNILSWMGAVASPDLCAGGLMYNSEGATFNVVVNSSAHTGVINFQWHYRIPAAKGKPNTNCTDANDPNRDRADVCGASWSATKEP